MDYKNDLQSDDDFDCSNSYSDNYQSSSNASNQSQQGGRLSNASTAGMSKAELRKTNKPIMEKRRRARINHCLNELKSLILEAMKKDPARHTKLEKADILEMTVKHLQSVQRQQLNMAIQTDPTVIHKFKTGFMECAEEVNRYINQLEGLDPTVKLRLNNHLNNCASNLDQISSMSQFTNGYSGGSVQSGLFGSTLSLPPAATLPSLAVTNGAASLFPSLSQDLNNNQGAPIQMGGVRLIPSRLPSGEFALIMPNSGTNQNLASSLLNPSRSASFASWNPSNSSSGLPKSSLSPQFNDFTHNFKRLSAFSKPQATLNPANNKISATTSSGYQQTCLATANYQHIIQPSSAFHTTTTTSPPLSPISTISSQNDDSITHNSSDYTNSQDNNNNAGDSNVQQTSFKGAFNTPPSSADSSLIVTSATHLQQQQVSSTSNTSELNQSTASSSKADSLLLNTSNHGLKRSFSEATDSGIFSEDELPSAKKYFKDLNNQDNEEQDNMWRPW